MNIVRHTLLCSFAVANLHANPEATHNNPQDFSQWRNEQAEQFETLNGGHSLADLNGDLVKFIREHAQEIAAELEYLIDHANPTAHAAYYAELVQLLSIQSFSNHDELAQVQAVGTQFVMPDGKRVAVTALMSGFWSATNRYLSQTVSPETCPILHQALPYVAMAETATADLNKLPQEQLDPAFSMPVLDEQTEAQLLESLAGVKYTLEAGYTYMQTEEHVTLLKNLVRAWAALMKEDSFFEALQTKGFSPTLQATLPETFIHFSKAANDYGQAFENAVAPAHDELGYEADDELSDGDMDEDSDDCIEYDFNQQFRNRHAK